MPSRLLETTAALAVACLLGLAAAKAETPAPTVTILFEGNETVLDQPIAYPEGTPQVTGMIVALAPGGATGWHRHDAPLFAYMLEGELTVDYGPNGTRRYVAGDSLLEAVRVAHNGRNMGATTARVLVVYMGADGVANSTPTDAPD